MSQMVRICKVPYISEDTNQWGISQGTFYVVDVQGYIDLETWEEIKLYEGYSETTEGKSEQACVINTLKTGTRLQDIIPPLMSRLIGRANGLLWQFNLCSKELSEGTAEYTRTYAHFNEHTLAEWSPQHDEKVKKLQSECDRMNRKAHEKANH